MPIDKREKKEEVRGREGKRKKGRTNVWGENEKIVFYNIEDVFIFPSVCERGDNIIEYEAKK
jgi:hypothetical protein